MGFEPSARMSARTSAAPVSYRNFLQWVAPGIFCRLRSGRNAVNDSGIVDRWCAGERNAGRSVEVSGKLRKGMLWRRRCLS